MISIGLGIGIDRLQSAPVVGGTASQPPAPPPEAVTLDFSNAAVPSGVTVTRATQGTRFRQTKAIGIIGANSARFNYNLGSGQLDGILVEPAQPDFGFNGRDFSDWSLFRIQPFGAGSIVNDPSVVCVSGGTGMDLLRESLVSGTHYMQKVISLTAAGMVAKEPCRFSGMAKAFKRYMKVEVIDGDAIQTTANRYGCIFNVATGQVVSSTKSGNATFAGASITPCVNGTFYWSIWGKASSGSNRQSVILRVYLMDGLNDSYTGDGSELWLDMLTFSKGYAETSLVASGARAADVINIPIPNGLWDIQITDNIGQLYYHRDVNVSAGTWAATMPVEAEYAGVRFIRKISYIAAPNFESLIDGLNTPPIVTYEAVAPTGGDGGTTYTVTSLADDANGFRRQLQRPNKRIIRFDAALTGKTDFMARGGAFSIENGDLTIVGHKRIHTAIGNPLTFKAKNICVINLSMAPGFEPFKYPFAKNKYTGYQPTWADVPYDVGSNPDIDNNAKRYDDRDAAQVLVGSETILFRNCNFMYSYDEACSIYSHLLEQTPYIKNVLYQNCIFGPAIVSVLHSEAELPSDPHNYGGLAADKVVNVGYIENLFIGCFQRNPQVGNGNGLFAINNIIYNWGDGGSSVRNYFPDGRWTNPMNATAAFIGNLYKPGPNTAKNTGTREGALTLWRAKTGMALYCPDNYYTDGIDFNGDDYIDRLDGVFREPTKDKPSSKICLKRAMPFSIPYTAQPTSTASQRQALWNRVLNKVGVRDHDGSDNPITGDAAASVLTKNAIDAVRGGTFGFITDPAQFGGYAV